MEGAELRRLRTAAGVTQKELAERLGYKNSGGSSNHSIVARMENGYQIINKRMELAIRYVLEP